MLLRSRALGLSILLVSCALGAGVAVSCSSEDPVTATVPDSGTTVTVPEVDSGSSDAGVGPVVDAAEAGIDYCKIAAANPFNEPDSGLQVGVDGGGTYPNANYPVENPPTPEKAVLGKILFWDEQMSSDNTVACGTCHRGAAGGSDPRANEMASRHPGPDGVSGTADDVHGARGIARCTTDASGVVTRKADPVFGMNPQVTKRKPPSYLDAMFAAALFWDGRATDKFVNPDDGTTAIATGGALESQVVKPPVGDVEMACEGRTWPEIHRKLAAAKPLALARDVTPDIAAALCAHPTYPDLFQAAFGTPVIDTKRVAFAIATHERRLVSNQTPYDRFVAGDTSALTADQKEGRALIQAGAGLCQRCHQTDLFGGNTFANLGFVNANFDTGQQVISTLVADRGKFRVPTLRNAGLREAAGLLHDGVSGGATIDALMTKYKTAPQVDSSTDPRLKTALALTQTQLDHMTDFIRNGLTDPRVKNETFPFDHPKLQSQQ